MKQRNNMYTFSRVGTTIVVLFFLCVPFAAHATEVINLFSSDITIHKDSTITVVETIDYDFGSTTPKHGIFRFIPTTHPEKASSWYKERYIDIQVNGVQRDGKDEMYVVSDEKGKVNVKIGNAGVTMTGRHVYQIAYTLQGALSYPAQLSPELYWNVNGNEWTAPMLRVRATLHDNGLLSNQRSCYKGHLGESTSCTIHTIDNAVTFEASLVSPSEEMTIANALNENVVAKVMLERFKIVMLALIFIPLLLAGLALYIYRYQTHFKINRPIVAQYEPYPGILPMYTGVLIDGTLDPKDISAGIVYLAERKYIKIRKTEKKVLFLFEVDDYEITLLRPFLEDVAQSQGVALGLLFESGAPAGKTIMLSELKTMYIKQEENRKKIETLKTSVINDLSALGFYQQPTFSRFSAAMKEKYDSGSRWVWLGLVLILAGIVQKTHSLVFIALCLAVIALHQISDSLFSVFLRRLTTKGYEAKNHLLGFKLFLTITDEERFSFHNAPAKSPEQFMEYLPYAIAFGVEKEWAKVFENITIPTPDWYDGGAVIAFSPTSFTTSLGAFSGALASSGGSVSASGGGGSSGGGGGGGGGGSW